MERRNVRYGFAAVITVTFVWVGLCGTLGVSPAWADKDRGTVFSHFEFDADRSGQLKVSESTRLQVPVSDPMVRKFLVGAAGGGDAARARKRRARKWIDADLGLFNYLLLEEPVSLGAVEIERGRLGVEAEEGWGEESEKEVEEEGEGQWLGPFHLGWRDGARLVSARPSDTADVDWVVTLKLDQTAIESVSPPPTVLDRDGSHTTVTWRFPPGEAAPLRVDLEPPWAVRFTLDESSVWSTLRLGTYLWAVLLPLPVLFLLLRRADLRDALPDIDLLRHQLVRLLIAAVPLLLIVALIWVLTKAPGWFGPYARWSTPPRLLLASFGTLLATVCAAAVFAAGRRPSAWRWILPAWALVAAAIVLTHVRLERSIEGTPSSWDLILTGLNLLAICLVTFGLLDGFLRIGLYWPQARRDRAAAFAAWRPRADLLALLLGAGLIAIVLHSLTQRLEGLAFASKVLYEVPTLIIDLALLTAPLMALVLLPAALRLLGDTERPAPFLVSERGRWLVAISLFLLFVVPAYGLLAGFLLPVPLLVGVLTFALLAAIRLVRLERLEREVALRNRPLGPLGETRILMRSRREIVDRALLVERLQRERRRVRQRGEDDGGWAEEQGAERSQLARLDAAEEYLQTGDPPPGTTTSRADRDTVSLRFPTRPPLLYPALGCGPGADWRESARVALRYGAWLSLLPLTFFVFTMLREELDEVLHSSTGTEPLLFLASLGQELAFWLVAAYVFGCLFTWLPGGNGALKGLVLSLPVVIAVAAMALCPVFQVEPDLTLRPFALLIFLSLLGLLLDFRTVRGVGLRARSLADLYQVRSFRFGLVNLVPLLIAAVGIYQGIQAGNPQEAIENAVRSAPSQPGGEGAPTP